MFREKFLRQRIEELDDRYSALTQLIGEYFREAKINYATDPVMLLRHEIARLRKAREEADARAIVRKIVEEVIIETAKGIPHGD